MKWLRTLYWKFWTKKMLVTGSLIHILDSQWIIKRTAYLFLTRKQFWYLNTKIFVYFPVTLSLCSIHRQQDNQEWHIPNHRPRTPPLMLDMNTHMTTKHTRMGRPWDRMTWSKTPTQHTMVWYCPLRMPSHTIQGPQLNKTLLGCRGT